MVENCSGKAEDDQEVDDQPGDQAGPGVLPDSHQEQHVHHQLCGEGRHQHVQIVGAREEGLDEMPNRSGEESGGRCEDDPEDGDNSKEHPGQAKDLHSSLDWEKADGGHGVDDAVGRTILKIPTYNILAGVPSLIVIDLPRWRSLLPSLHLTLLLRMTATSPPSWIPPLETFGVQYNVEYTCMHI